jgi:AmmeMemoRadiSam system protein B
MIKELKTLIGVSLITAVILSGVTFVRIQKGKVAGTHTPQTPVRGLILPHHALADELIQKSFEKLKNENYSYVVILGPNHYQPEVNSIITAKNIPDYSFESEVATQVLQQYPDIAIADELVAKEHSITLHLPYIEKYFPNARVMPFMISPTASKNDLFDKMGYLTSILPTEALYIASVDFAHNVLQDEGLKNNQDSITAISNFDYQTLLSYDDVYMDSPLSIASLLKITQGQNATKFEVWENSHAAILEGDPQVLGTSYVIGVFR